MTYQTIVGWSLVSSGIVTLLIGFLPGSDLLWGTALLGLGLVTLYVRH